MERRLDLGDSIRGKFLFNLKEECSVAFDTSCDTKTRPHIDIRQRLDSLRTFQQSHLYYQHQYFSISNRMILIVVIVALFSTPVVILRLHTDLLHLLFLLLGKRQHSEVELYQLDLIYRINSRLTTTGDQLWLPPLAMTSCTPLHENQRLLFH